MFPFHAFTILKVTSQLLGQTVTRKRGSNTVISHSLGPILHILYVRSLNKYMCIAQTAVYLVQV